MLLFLKNVLSAQSAGNRSEHTTEPGSSPHSKCLHSKNDKRGEVGKVARSGPDGHICPLLPKRRPPQPCGWLNSSCAFLSTKFYKELWRAQPNDLKCEDVMPLCCALLFRRSQLWQFILLENVFRMSVTSAPMLAICMLHTCWSPWLCSIVIFLWGWGRQSIAFCRHGVQFASNQGRFLWVQLFLSISMSPTNKCLWRVWWNRG